jgi:hypothetical protein
MNSLPGPHLVVAVMGEDGKGHFAEVVPPQARLTVPDIVDVAYVWETTKASTVPGAIGGPPRDIGFPAAGGTKFGIVLLPPHSAGKSVPEQGAAIGADYHDDGMHMSDTIDYDIVIQGKVDIVLDSGELRTLSAGSMVVMGGVNHSWQNRYDEPCLMATITVGTASDRS